MPKKTARPKKIVTLAERIQHLADAWEREAKSLGAYLTPEHETDSNHPSGHNRAYHRFAGMVQAIGFLPNELRDGLTLSQTDAQRLAVLSDARLQMVARRLEAENFLEDNAEHLYLPTQWELEGRALKLRHLIDALDDLVKAHNEQREG